MSSPRRSGGETPRCAEAPAWRSATRAQGDHLRPRSGAARGASPVECSGNSHHGFLVRRSSSPRGFALPPDPCRSRSVPRSRPPVNQESELVPTPDAIYAVDGPVATLTFNRPAARNAMTWAMYDALVDACDAVDDDPAVKVLVLRGAGDRAFVAGTDISQFPGPADPRRRPRVRVEARSGPRPAGARPDAHHRPRPGGGRRGRLRHGGRLRPAHLRPRGPLRHPRRPHPRQLPVGRQLRPAA